MLVWEYEFVPLGNKLSIMQILHFLMHDFMWEQYCMTAENCTPMNQADDEYTKRTHAHTSNIYRLRDCTTHGRSYTHPHLVLQLSVTFQTPLPFHSNSQAIGLVLTSASELQVSFKIKRHNLCSMCVFISHLRWGGELYYCFD